MIIFNHKDHNANNGGFNHTTPFMVYAKENAIILEDAPVLSNSFTVCIPKYSPGMGTSSVESKSINVRGTATINDEVKGSGSLTFENSLVAENHTSYFMFTYGDVKDGDMESSVGITEMGTINPNNMSCPYTGSPHAPFKHQHDIKQPFVFNKMKFSGHNNMTVSKGTWVVVDVIGGNPNDLGVTHIRQGIPRTYDHPTEGNV